VSEIQRLTNDKTLTRAQINEAYPGFARKSADSVTEPPDEAEGDGGTVLASDPSSDEGQDDFIDGASDNERLRAIAFKRVQDAEEAIADAKRRVSEAQREVHNAEQRHTRALQLFSAKYPPLTAAENIKQHLRRQAEVQRERVEGMRFVQNSPQNPVDATLMDRKRDNGRNSLGKKPASFLPRSLAVGSSGR